MNMIKVTDLKAVDTTRYSEGVFLYSDKQVGYIRNGKIEPLLTRSEIKKMIQDEIKRSLKK